MASCVALVKPTRDGTSSEEPPSGTSPMLTKASWKNADSAATIRSQASARESPIPAAGPLTAAMTGLGMCRMPVMIGWYRCGQPLVHVHLAAGRARLLQVGAAGEGPPGAGDLHGPDLGVVGDRADRRQEIEGELVIPGVQPLGAVQLEPGAVAPAEHVDGLVLAVRMVFLAHAGHANRAYRRNDDVDNRAQGDHHGVRQGSRPEAAEAGLRAGAVPAAGRAGEDAGVDAGHGRQDHRDLRGPRRGRQGRHDPAGGPVPQPPVRHDRGPARADRAGADPVVLPALRRAPARRGRAGPVRPQLVQPGRRGARHGVLHAAGVQQVPAPVPDLRAAARRGRHPAPQVLVLGQRRGAAAPLP